MLLYYSFTFQIYPEHKISWDLWLWLHYPLETTSKSPVGHVLSEPTVESKLEQKLKGSKYFQHSLWMIVFQPYFFSIPILPYDLSFCLRIVFQCVLQCFISLMSSAFTWHTDMPLHPHTHTHTLHIEIYLCDMLTVWTDEATKRERKPGGMCMKWSLPSMLPLLSDTHDKMRVNFHPCCHDNKWRKERPGCHGVLWFFHLNLRL